MTLNDLIEFVKALQKYDLDNAAGKDPTNKILISQINRALRFISRKIRLYDPKVVLTLVAGQKTYRLDDTTVFSVPMIQPTKIFINGAELFGPNSYTRIYSMTSLDEFFPGWRTVASGTPAYAALQPGGKIVLAPSPDATCIAAGSNWAAGYTYAPTLSAMTDIPQIPDYLHEAVAELAAEYSSQPTASDAMAWQRLAAYRLNWSELIRQEAQRNMSLVAPFDAQGSRWSDLIDV